MIQVFSFVFVVYLNLFLGIFLSSCWKYWDIYTYNLEKNITYKSCLKTSFSATPIRVKLNCDFFLLWFQRFKVWWDRRPTEPGLGVFGNVPNKQVIFCLAAVGPLNIEFVNHHLYLPSSGLRKWYTIKCKTYYLFL